MNIKRDIVLRSRIAFVVILIFSIAIVYKIAKIQIIDNKKWKTLADQNVFEFKVVKATRGNIYSDNGSLLATSLPFYRISIDASTASDEVFRKGVDSLSFLLANHFKDRSAKEYFKKLNDARSGNKKYLILNRTMINYQTKKMMSEWPIIREGKYKGGVIFEKIEKRFKPFSFLAMRTIGFINENSTGAGLEFSYNNYLAGRNGEALFQKMSGGNWKPVHNKNEIAPEPGVDIQTTIDINIQDVAEASLFKHLNMHNAEYGCVVLMEVETGEIKAIANLGKIREGEYAENYNYAIANQGLTDPGSTFKLASMVALFEDNPKLKLSDTIDCGNGRYTFFDQVMTDSKEGGYGRLSVQQVFEKSSNIGVSKMIYKQFGTNPQRYVDYLKGMGLSDPLGLQVVGEAKPYIKKPSSKSEWSGTTLPWMSIGYELKFAPIHTLTFYNAIANNGKMVKPIIVKEVKVADRVVESYPISVIKERVCSDETLDKLHLMLEGVVEHGTAKNINNAIYKIAGKTGTARKIKDGIYVKEYYTSFVGYFPADKPKYSCIVVIDSPKGGQQYGSDVAAPVFKEIADKLYAVDLELHPPTEPKLASSEITFPLIKSGYFSDLNYLCNEFGISNHSRSDADDEWVFATTSNNAVMWNNRKVKEDLVPDVNGMMLKDALFLLENSGLKVKIQGSGRVQSQSQTPGSKAVKGSYINIYLE